MAQILDQTYGHSAHISWLRALVRFHRLPHCMIFSGPSGIGKKRLALGLCQELLCEHRSLTSYHKACGSCPQCYRVEKKASESILIIEPDKLQIKVDKVVDILNFVSLQKWGQARIIIIDSAHLMNSSFANGVLKIIEDPPEQTYFILVTSHLASLLPTVRSRSQVFHFAPLDQDTLKRVLKQVVSDHNVIVEDWMIQYSQGRPEVLYQLTDPQISRLRIQACQALDLIFQHPLEFDLFEIVEKWTSDKSYCSFVTQCWQRLIRDALVGKMCGQRSRSQWSNQDQQHLIEKLMVLSQETLIDIWNLILQIDQDLRSNVDRGLVFEDFFWQAKQREFA